MVVEPNGAEPADDETDSAERRLATLSNGP